MLGVSPPLPPQPAERGPLFCTHRQSGPLTGLQKPSLHTCLAPSLPCRHCQLRAAGGDPCLPQGAAWPAGGAELAPAAGGPHAAAGTAAAGWAERGQAPGAVPAAEAGAAPSPAQAACCAPPAGLHPPLACAAGLRPRPAYAAARPWRWWCWAPRQLLLPALSLQARHQSLQSHKLQVLEAVRGGLLKSTESGT